MTSGSSEHESSRPAATALGAGSGSSHGKRPSAADLVELRKLRRRVDPSKRKRIALACDSCKRRKQKCNGEQPCSICKKKNFYCHYTPTRQDSLPADDGKDEHDESETERERSEPETPARSMSVSSNGRSDHRDRESPPARDRADRADAGDSASEAPPPPAAKKKDDYQVETVGDGQNTRLLWDSKGHLRYMGESGVLSFLEQSRKVFRKMMGDSSFTLDPAQFRFIDGPSHAASLMPIQLPSRSLTTELINSFEENVQALDYVLDMDHFRRLVAQTFDDPMNAPRQWLCMLHFVCALGAVFVSSKRDLGEDSLQDGPFNPLDVLMQPSGDGQPPAPAVPTAAPAPGPSPAVFFESGLGLMSDAAEDGELWVVQAHLLMCLYYQITCKRNASWIHLGSAIRFAQALGLHRKCVNLTFPKQQRILRRRLWRTLYIQDRFWSSSLGRPLAIDDCDWDDRDTSELQPIDRTVVELSEISEIIGDICLLVYRPQSISSSTSQKLATRLREWSDHLPEDMKLASLNLILADINDGGYERIRSEKIRNQRLLRLHLTHLNSIILLTRPFFLLMVGHVQPATQQNFQKTISRLSSACVLCAARSVDLVMSFFSQNQQPIRSHLMIYYIFTAGIVLLLESFHQRRSEVDSYITRGIFLCIFILGYYGKCDPSAKRYRIILQDMDRAARASRSINNANVTDKRSEHIAQINKLLNSANMAQHGANDNLGFQFFSNNLGSVDHAASVAASVAATPAVVSAVSSAGMPVSAPAAQAEGGIEYENEKYLNDMLSHHQSANVLLASGNDGGTNLSRMFLKAAANDGRYQPPESPAPGGLAAAQELWGKREAGLGGDARRSMLSPGAVASRANRQSERPDQGAMNISPQDAMSQFLMDDTFNVGAATDSIDFSFDLDMMEWLSGAGAINGATPAAPTPGAAPAPPAGAPTPTPMVADVAGQMSDVDSLGMNYDAAAVAAANSAEGVMSSDFLKQQFPANDTVFRGLMMNAEY
ncbi:fungal-specific transcription factor domain-containing protein [Dipodascopsis tothii]|uniref:fungal-specific transcription factor domain-containing protein n=1 Tax=Dipodascopsis tothii TaxID=44089 RepID=UPI0034CF3CDB